MRTDGDLDTNFGTTSLAAPHAVSWPGEFVDAPLTVCEERDPNGLYRKARRGQIANFTGLDSPHEAPENPEIRLDTSVLTIEQTVADLVDYLQRGGKLRIPD
jgi:adenylylsulfate kinase